MLGDDLKILIEAYNAPRMRDRAWRYVFEGDVPAPKRKGIPHEIQTTIRWLTILALTTFRREIGVPKMKLRQRVAAAIDKQPTAADSRIDRMCFLANVEEPIADRPHAPGPDRPVRLTDAGRDRMLELAKLLELVGKATLAQHADPRNPDAGREFLPEEVYYHYLRPQPKEVEK